MKKYWLRATVFILTFALGVGLVSLLIFILKEDRIDCELRSGYSTEKRENPRLEITKKPFDVEVRFKEFVPNVNGLAPEFVVTNVGNETAFYSSLFAPEEKKEPIFIHPEIKVNGEKVYQMTCGTGLQDFALSPGETIVVRLNGGFLGMFWEKGKTIQLGFYFRKDGNEEYQIFWGDILPVSDSTAQQLSAEQRKKRN